MRRSLEHSAEVDASQARRGGLATFRQNLVACVGTPAQQCKRVRDSGTQEVLPRTTSTLVVLKASTDHALCEEYISTTGKWLRKLYIYSMNHNMNFNTSDEDKHDTNYINKNDANTDTRKLHL